MYVGLSKSFRTNSGPDSFRSHHKKNQDEKNDFLDDLDNLMSIKSTEEIQRSA
jgi:hypothetical protein